MNAIVARQAILDKNKHTFGYELLYRENTSRDNSSTDLDGNVATVRVIANTFLHLGIQKIAKRGKVFINFTRDLIVQKIYELLPKEKIVVEVLEDVAAEADVIESLRYAKQLGYTIALDDFVFSDSLEELVKLADIIKIDFMQLNQKEIIRQVELYNSYNLKLLAEKVEENSEFEFARNLGFDYFQGFFFCKPAIESKKEISLNQITILKAIGTVNNPENDLNDLIEIIRYDVYLYTKILTFVNSPFVGLGKTVRDIKQAVILLGFERVREWLNIVYMSELSKNKPEELIILAAVRAKFASLLAEQLALNKNDAFMLGMFSTLDAVLNLPMEKALKELGFLSKSVCDALLGQDNDFKAMLDFIKLLENGESEGVYLLANRLSIDVEKMKNHYYDSMELADYLYSL